MNFDQLIGLDKFIKHSNKVANQLGLITREEKDAFRHAYTSALVGRGNLLIDGGIFIAGAGREAGAYVIGRNSGREALKDTYNNATGLILRGAIEGLPFSHEKKNWLLQNLIKQGIDKGFILQKEGEVPSLQDYFPHEKERQNDARERGQKLIQGASPKRNRKEKTKGRVEVDEHQREGHDVRAHTRGWPE